MIKEKQDHIKAEAKQIVADELQNRIIKRIQTNCLNRQTIKVLWFCLWVCIHENISYILQ